MTPLPGSPIADLSYRNYDGPLEGTQLRWWVIAKQMILKALRMKSLWVFTVLAGWYFIVMVIVMFVFQELSSINPQLQQSFKVFIDKIVWKDQFFHGFSYAQHLLLVVALIVGAGAIANDNRANALLVYLSKPCTKLDYMIGKWVGVFVPILIVISAPVFVFYAYGVFSFREQGFFRGDPWLLIRVLAVLPLSAALHASIILAVSSMFKQGRIAGATYAGLYFLSNFFTVLMEAIWMHGRGGMPPIIHTLFYCSIDGVQIGLAKAIIKPTDTGMFGLPLKGAAPPEIHLIPYLAFVFILGGLCCLFSWSRVRAVEVV